MKGLKEILLSFSLGLATILTFTLTQKKERSIPVHDEPTAISGESEDANLSLTWGVQEIHAPAAWKRQTGSRNVTVAVIDTGCDVHHPALSRNIWINPGESGLDRFGNNKASNGVDDDGNGFVDDLHGWNFADHDSDIADDHGHGTHIAGIIGAEHGTGVSPHVSLMILKYFNPDASGPDNLRHTISAIRYAVKMGADIINYSGGGVVKSREEEEALRWAAAQGVLVVAAAGNEGVNSDFFHFYPADYDLPNILSVAAIDQHEELMRISNYGIQTVALAAPGKNIYSTLPGGEYGYMSGTSQATAFATGVAALLIANDPQMRNPRALISHMLASASRRTALRTKLRSAGILDAKLALERSNLELSSTDN
jgi:subtilisin family serine protease